MKNAIKLIGFALVAAIGFAMTACPTDGGDGGGTGANIPGVNQLPAFPAGSTPAATKADAEAILAELRLTRVRDSLYDEVSELWKKHRDNTDDNGNISYIDTLPNGYVKVTYSGTGNTTSTGGFKDYIHQFASNDKQSSTSDVKEKVEVTRDKAESGVTIVKGSMDEYHFTSSGNSTVVTPGTDETARINRTENGKEQDVLAYTITTFSGSVKIILDLTREINISDKNVLVDYEAAEYDKVGTKTRTVKYSGSLKVYGKDNKLLIDHRIVDQASAEMAFYMIGYDPYPFNPVNVQPLTNNTVVNGNIDSSGSVVWYSINVTKGTRYHLWWNDEYDEYGSMDFRVRGYYSDGNVIFDMSSGWIPAIYLLNDCSFTASSTGTVYIMVYPYDYDDWDYETTFSIVYNTSGNKPSMQ
jgi:hypothetical protein